MKTRKAHTVLVIMLAIHFPQSDSTAVITTEGSLRERSDFECGTSVVIICTTQPKPNDVIWTVDNVWTADCTFGVCTENSSNPAFYTFSHNATEGVFHLNIQPVSFQQNGKIYACTEGSGPTEMSDTLTAEVNVLPDISTAIDATSNTQVVVTTGCVYPVTNITFEWYIYQVGIEAMLYTKQKPVQTFNDSGCSLGDCGHSEAARVSSTLDIPSVETGDLYFFQVIVKHAATNKVVILNSTVKYRINALPATSSTHITSDRILTATANATRQEMISITDAIYTTQNTISNATEDITHDAELDINKSCTIQNTTLKSNFCTTHNFRGLGKSIVYIIVFSICAVVVVSTFSIIYFSIYSRRKSKSMQQKHRLTMRNFIVKSKQMENIEENQF